MTPFQKQFAILENTFKYLVTILRYFILACSRDIIVDWCELLICPIDKDYKICGFSKRFDDNNKSLHF